LITKNLTEKGINPAIISQAIIILERENALYNNAKVSKVLTLEDSVTIKFNESETLDFEYLVIISKLTRKLKRENVTVSKVEYYSKEEKHFLKIVFY